MVERLTTKTTTPLPDIGYKDFWLEISKFASPEMTIERTCSGQKSVIGSSVINEQADTFTTLSVEHLKKLMPEMADYHSRPSRDTTIHGSKDKSLASIVAEMETILLDYASDIRIYNCVVPPEFVVRSMDMDRNKITGSADIGRSRKFKFKNKGIVRKAPSSSVSNFLCLGLGLSKRSRDLAEGVKI